jgi:SagB-type dehydrogenase family enzyme
VRHEGAVALEKALFLRRSVREFRAAPLDLADVGQLLWAAQGSTRDARRTAPSAGALYPLETYLVASHVEGVPAGVYRYQSDAHRLTRLAAGNRAAALALAALGQDWLAEAAAIVVLAAVEQRTTAKYGRRGVRYVWMEAGHAAQNVLLQAAALGIGATPVGAFDDAQVHEVLGLSAAEQPLYLFPLGRPR